MSWEDLELFSNSGAKISSPVITITGIGTINFNAGFFHAAKEEVRDNKYVELRFSKVNNAIVLQFTNVLHEKSSMKITRANNAANGSIAARSFLNFYGIKQTGKYIPKLENIPNIGAVWVVYLNERVN